MLKLGFLEPGGNLFANADLALGYSSSADAYVGVMLIDRSSRDGGLGKTALARLEGLATRGRASTIYGFDWNMCGGNPFLGAKRFRIGRAFASPFASQVSTRLRYVGAGHSIICDYRPEDLDGVINVGQGRRVRDDRGRDRRGKCRGLA
ncbi:hypothetical protein [Neorhizobium petrolearium]|uniref:hypothetical protein n=1 Tax=Neorhizobium petrolearium TaxID=515361 RepID=UPI003F145A50